MNHSKKRYLMQIKECREKIQYARERKAEMRLDYTALSGIDYTRDRIHVTPSNMMELMAWRLLERCEVYNNMIYYYITELDARLKAISDVGEPYSRVLLSRFSDYMTYDEISYDMKKSVSWVKKMCAEGVEKICVSENVLYFRIPEDDEDVEILEEDY